MDIIIFVIFLAIAFCIAIVWKTSEFIALLGTGIPAIVGVIVVVYVLFHIGYFGVLGVFEDDCDVSVGEFLSMTLVTMGADFPILSFVIFYLPLMSSQMGEAYIDDYISFFFKLILVIVLHFIVWLVGWGIVSIFLRMEEVVPILGIVLAIIVSIGIVVLTIRLDNKLTQGALVELYGFLKLLVV
jgi:hypothetical protein